jgi:hypothetical protein
MLSAVAERDPPELLTVACARLTGILIRCRGSDSRSSDSSQWNDERRWRAEASNTACVEHVEHSCDTASETFVIHEGEESP